MCDGEDTDERGRQRRAIQGRATSCLTPAARF